MAMISLHTSPLAQPGAGDAGGLNVYVLETARRLGRRGIDVEIVTRATSSQQPPEVAIGDGVLVRHLVAGPFEGERSTLPGAWPTRLVIEAPIETSPSTSRSAHMPPRPTQMSARMSALVIA